MKKKKTKEELYKLLRSLRTDLLTASSKADMLSRDMPRDFDLTKPFNILGKEISDLIKVVSYLMGEADDKDLKEWAVRPPTVTNMVGIKDIRKYFKGDVDV